jgi:hypothetical protein
MDIIEKTISRFKNFQLMILDISKSQHDIYLESERLIEDLHECSKAIEAKQVDMSVKLTDHMNTGRWQT